MKLRVLMDNHTEIDAYYLGEPAVSYWIEDEGRKFLFDTGYSDAFLKNAAADSIAPGGCQMETGDCQELPEFWL